ncbi:RHS repeat protein [Pseudomonas sp. PDM02]|uniref:RHS repeat domain-containing protein n=1 Tax=Pseudomonas sp. PDM02 TaxID=2769267 RepID=UPI00177E751F|nr:RHS repeat protein [Pseudomonas sp. PDM02]MBD9614127.1 RHS repeat protein [Pseudomonas sp. PDM02]
MSIHSHTPQLAVIDNRGLPVRQVEYWRRDAAELRPEALVTAQEHDGAGRLVAQRDPRFLAPASRPNMATVYSLSGAALCTESRDAGWRLGLPDKAGNMREHWDGRGSHWQNEYDAQRRLTAVHEQSRGSTLRTVERLTYADNAGEFAERNQCGQVIRHDDRAGCVWLNQQALSGGLIRQTRRFLPENSDVQADWSADEAERDALLQPGAGYITASRFGPSGQVFEQTDAGGHRQHFSVDRAGQLQRIDLTLDSQGPQPLLKAASYNAEGQLLTQVTGNDVTSSATYEAASGRLKRLTATTPEGARLQDLRYEYDPVGSILRIVDHTQPVTFFANQRVAAENTYTYDSLYQLISATGRETANAGQNPGLPELITPCPIDPARLLNFTEFYEYDASGNRTELRHVSDGNPFRQQLRVDPQSNRALPWNDGEDEPDFPRNFDANGNQQYLAPGAQPMTWDALNQLQSVTTVGRPTEADDAEGFRYNAAGERVAKFSTQQAHAVAHRRVVHYLPGLEVRTTDDDEELHVICVPLARGSVRCLYWVKGKPGDIEADQLRYCVDDHLGSCSLELDKHAGVISHEGYYPYGGTAWWAARSKVDADYKTVRYSGKERDACGLYYYGFRYFAPWLGRWVNPDPAGSVDGLNLYCFCGNNPVCRTDSDGRFWGPYEEAIDAFLEIEPVIRAEYGLPPIVLPASELEDDESMDYQDSPESFASHDSPGESSPGSADSPVPPPSPTNDQNTVLDILNANPDKPVHYWNDANLLERTSFGGKVYLADRRPPEEVLRDGFNATTEFISIRKMLSNEALTVSETLEGVLFYAAQSQDNHYFYEIDADEVGGVSLLENLVLNTPRLRQHLNNPDPTYTLDDQTGLSNRMREAHLNFDDLNDGKPRIKSLGRLPEEMKRARVTVNH